MLYLFFIFSGHGGNNMAAAALDKRIRERERLRRHAVEKPETLPSFAEPPRKINVRFINFFLE